MYIILLVSFQQSPMQSKNAFHGVVRFLVLSVSLLVSAHLIWEFSSQSISVQSQDFLHFESDIYRTKEHRLRRANFTLSRISSAPIGTMHDMNSYASKRQSTNMPSNFVLKGIDSRQAHESGMLLSRRSKLNNFHDTM